MSYNETKNKADETEKLSADDKKLHQLLGGLKKVSAPKNFDFQLKARIANTQPRDLRRPVLLPFLRYALPLSVIVLLAGFVFFNLSFSTENQNAPVIADITPEIQNQNTSPEPVAVPSINESLTTSTNTDINSEGRINTPETVNLPKKNVQEKLKYVAVKNPPVNRNEKTENNSKINGGGSVDSTSRETTVIRSNTNANSDSPKPPGIAQHTISLREVLSRIGIEAEYDGENWKILSIKENSIATRSEMKVGDIIEAVDNKKLSSDVAFLKTFSARIFRIVRDGKQIILTAK